MIIITGGAGFIGSAMLWELNRNGTDEVLIVDDLGRASEGRWLNLRGLRYTDFIHKDDLPDLLEHDRLPKIDAVIHMGAISSTTEQDANLLLRNNYEYSKMLASWCAKKGVRFIYASSAATFGDGSEGYSDGIEVLDRLRPLNMYGYSKHLFDCWALRNGILEKAAGLKFFNVYGPNEYHKEDMTSVVFKAFHQIGDNGKVRLFRSHNPQYADGEQLRDFVYVKDCTKIMQWLLETPSATGLFNIGTGQARSFRDLVIATFTAMDRPVSIEFIDMPETIRDKYQYYTCADSAHLRQAGYTGQMTPLEEGVRDYVQNYLSKPSPHLDTLAFERQ
ncbi:MAG TPA: ADP-glyceromanno-heptose 6-epimerase [Chlorobaculum sp.]|uniref:ADP-L-glycero-D-manno-heptose-6-epimerase n=1 Tax=Chlorobaculum tepidum (strain ATCC 49652 / DSM 12025 / NBRC 103806 / TLS) TaxID=194439 RepID=Q8KCZ9_CHLTE|nr:ADP-glyceromanno-heptose 6-epimerase [Chlorobaculum tepidum]AAM72488.1 ADP-L-glycero-D-mannoheptose-6-epimerase [Chlorobaculum tepidum TLS]HBU23569.1 ADP-glyceromanno-heptose 6-epimerase [Chlorobaculum sp.]